MKYALPFALVLLATPALAFDCPEGAKACKVLILTDEQATILDQLVSNTAVQGPYANIKAVVDSFKDMIAKAPAGTVKKAEDGKSDKK